MLRRFRSDPLKYALDLASFSFLLNVVLLIVVGLMWNAHGNISDLNPVIVGLTTIEIFLVAVALGGFWIVRGHAQNMAYEVSLNVAEKTAKEIAKEAAQGSFEDFKPELRRRILHLVLQELSELRKGAQDDEDLDFDSSSYDIAKAMDEENGGSDD